MPAVLQKGENFVSAAGNVFFRRKDNTMNVYDAMWRIFDYAISYLDIVPDTAASNEDVETIAKLLNAYDELEPDWSNAPDDAKWYTIDANGAATWSEEEPFFSSVGKFPEKFWDMNGNYYIEREPVRLPLGIDIRLCKWQRPEVTR